MENVGKVETAGTVLKVFVCLDCGRYSWDKEGLTDHGCSQKVQKAIPFMVRDLKIENGLVTGIRKEAIVSALAYSYMN